MNDHIDSVSELTSELMNKVYDWWDALVVMLPNLALAIIVMIIFILLGMLSKRLLSRVLRKFSSNVAINKLLATILHVSVLVVGMFVALDILNLDKTVTSMLAGVGVVGLALGFAFQNTATNFISGLFMATGFPLKVNDLVETNGFFGTVKSITLRYTTLENFTGQIIVLPNKQVLENPLTNYTITNERRVDIPCGVAYSDDLEKVQEVVHSTIKDRIDSTKPIEVFYNEFGASSINFTLRFWLNEANHKNWLEVRSDAIVAIKKAFDKEDITIPFPIRTIELGGREFKTLSNALEKGSA